MRAGSIMTPTSRFELPTSWIFPTPLMVSSRRLILRSASVVRSRAVSEFERTASETMGIPWMSSFWITGSFIWSGSSLRMPLIFARTSWETSLRRTFSSNSTVTTE